MSDDDTNPISAARDALAALLERDEWTVHSTAPEDLDLPGVLLQVADDDWIGDVDTYDATEHRLSMEIHLIPEYQSNDQLLRSFDRMVSIVLPLLRGTAWAVDRVSKPVQISANGWDAYAVVVSASTYIRLTAPEEA